MNDRLKRAVHGEPVPAHLDTRIRASLRAEPRSTRGPWFAPAWGLAATLSVIALGFFWLRRQENQYIATVTQTLSSVMRVGFSDHLHCTLLRRQPNHPETLETMQKQLGPRFVALLPVVQAHVPQNYQLLDAHQCTAQGRDFVHLVMNQGDRYLSVILTRKQPGEAFPAKDLIPQLAQAGITFYRQSTGTFQIAGFAHSDYLVYLISDFDAQQNQELLAALAPDLRKALTAL